MAGNSLFDQSNSEQQDDTLANLTPQDALATLVGEGKKFGSIEDLAKSYAHLNVHAGKLEQENGTFREELTKSKSVDDILAAIKGSADTSQSQTPDNSDTSNQDAAPDVESLIAKAFAERDAQSAQAQAQANVKSVVDELGKKLGVAAADAYKAKGAELGIDLDELAAKSPAAVLALFGNSPAQNQGNLNSATTNQNNVNVQQQGSDDSLTKAGLDKMFKEGKISREQKFRMEHDAIGKVGADKFFGRA